MSKDEDQIFLQNFMIIIVMMLGLICLFIILSQVLGSNEQSIARDRAIVLINQTQPIGRVRYNAASDQGEAEANTLTDQNSEAAETDPGKRVYDTLCTSCHSTGLPNVPQLGSATDWADRIAQGELLLYERAIIGFTGNSGMVMPAKGGNPSLSDDEIRAAVDYMVENSQ